VEGRGNEPRFGAWGLAKVTKNHPRFASRGRKEKVGNLSELRTANDLKKTGPAALEKSDRRTGRRGKGGSPQPTAGSRTGERGTEGGIRNQDSGKTFMV